MWKWQNVDSEYTEHAADVIVLEDGDDTMKGREECGGKLNYKNVVIVQSGAQGLIFTHFFVKAKKCV